MSVKAKRIEIVLWLIASAALVVIAYMFAADFTMPIFYTEIGFFILAAIRFAFMVRKL